MPKPLSIITAVHNGLAMNRVYWKALSQNTTAPFELIVVDNHSTDGTEEFFASLAKQSSESQKVIHLRNEFNQLYPASQNQGIRAATHDTLGFLNNDIWLPKGWNEPFEKALDQNPLLALSPSGQEAQPSQAASDKLKRRWQRVSYLSQAWAKLFFKDEEQRLWKALEWMYGDLESFKSPTPQDGRISMNGLKGDTILFRRAFMDAIGGVWDERIEAADWNLYLQAAREHENNPDFPLPQVLLNVYVHHFGRYSARRGPESMRDRSGCLPLEQCWSKSDIERLWWGNFLPKTEA